MRIEDIIEIRGRGPCAITRDVPDDCLGKLVRQGEHVWKIVGVGWPEIEGRRDLLLRAEPGSPKRPLVGKIELVD